MNQRIIIKPQRCVGCRTCEKTCAAAHELGGNSCCQTITLSPDEHVPMLCLQCEDAACAQSCPVAAIKLDEITRVVQIETERCIRCQACTVACPFGNIRYAAPLRQIHKCDLCASLGADKPKCVLTCPSSCLSLA